jgi:hypothetical protein
VKAQKWSRGVSVDQWSQILIPLMRIRILVTTKSRIRNLIKLESQIEISMKVKERSGTGSASKWWRSATIFRKICLHMYKQNIILMQHCEHGPLESADRKPWLKKNSLV